MTWLPGGARVGSSEEGMQSSIIGLWGAGGERVTPEDWQLPQGKKRGQSKMTGDRMKALGEVI